MKKTLGSMLLSFLLVGCGGGDNTNTNTNANNNPEVATPPTQKESAIPKELNTTLALRFLNKATFGATTQEVKRLQQIGVDKWLDEQLAMQKSEDVYLRKMMEISKQAEPDNDPESIEDYLQDNNKVFNKNVASFHSVRYRMGSWFDAALTQEDQLRHKVTYALSQIIVESDFEPIFTRRAEALARYFDILYNNAFGSYGQLLEDISLNSGMSLFLTFNGNKKLYQNKADISVYPDENYAREIMQLFSIGLNKLKLDGTPLKDAHGQLIPTYTQEDVNALARVFTGWDIKRNRKYGQIGFRRGDLTHQVEFTSKYHDFGAKTLLNQEIEADLSGKEDIQRAIEIIISQESVAPYISKNLIMRLTKSNPSPAYIERVATVFQQTQGDLKAVTKAIFSDAELWDDLKHNTPQKFKEPLLAYTQFLRAMHAKPFEKWYFCNYGGPDDANYSNCNVVHNEFLFNDTRKYLAQGAGLAPTVFNFYDNDYIPNDPQFQAKNYAAPEVQIQSDSMLINFNNRIYANLLSWEKGYLLEHYYKEDSNDTWHKYTSIEQVATKSAQTHNIPIYYIGADKMLLDASEEYHVMEQVIDGDSDGDFKNLQDFREEDYHGDEDALKALIEFEDKKLTGGMLTQEQKDTIFKALKDRIYNKYVDYDLQTTQYDWAPRSKKEQIFRNVIVPTIRAIVSSDVYMVE
jgi:uncharacterized protein (DUF1800 family)